MKILVLNAGSSSVKYRLFAMPEEHMLAGGVVERVGERESFIRHEQPGAAPVVRSVSAGDHRAAMAEVMAVLMDTAALADPSELHAIGHRVVHGGERLRSPARVTLSVLEDIRAVEPLAPLHNPASRAGIEVARERWPGVPQVAVFDTAFHRTLPPRAYLYALPYRHYEELGVRRYGFHGISHAHVAREAARMLGREPGQVDLITLHLGNGASATAVQAGRSVDTSMGMTPLEGLVMGTRAGDVDPGAVFHLARRGPLACAEIERMMTFEAGLRGICGDSDVRAIERRAAAGDRRAALALDVACYRIKKYIGAYTAVLGRVDAVVFTGGVGENSAEVRARSCDGLQGLGIQLDPENNAARADRPRDVAAAESRVRVYVIPTDEELEIARATLACVSGGGQ